MDIILWSTGALATGFILDIIFGDPYNLPHIVRWMGCLTSTLEKHLRCLLPSTKLGEKVGGVIIVSLMILICTGIPFLILAFFYITISPAGYIIESFLCWQLLAVKSLKNESTKVYHSLVNNDIEGARKNVSMIVGRDTKTLDQNEITRATVETIAENASDGVTAPLLYIMLGGAPLGCIYKAVNTMDSMIGYKNNKYIYFGRVAAKMDDVLNFIPSRICAMLMLFAAFLLKFDGKSAFKIWKRDRYNHASPNSAQTEAICAGALGIRLAGPASYFGKLQNKPYIGDDIRPITIQDIKSANSLMYVSSVLSWIIAILFRIIIFWGVFYANI